MKKAYWVQKSHLFRADEYICSNCGKAFKKPYRVCPGCAAAMNKTKFEPSWVDEAEALSALLDDDW